MTRRAKVTTILDAMRDPKLFGSLFSSNSWDAWVALLVALFGLPATTEQADLIRRCTGRTTLPTEPANELFCIVGRRGGKSRIAAALAVFLACFKKYDHILAPGECGVVMLIATDRRQARVLKRYISGLLRSVPILATTILNETAEGLQLTNRIAIEVHTASFRAVRGYTVVAALVDEIAFLPSEGSASPDSEILAALRPAMATVPGALLIAISSPYAMKGELYKAYRDHFGRDGAPVLVWQASTQIMNPTVPQAFIDAAYQADESSARAEYGAQFRQDVETFINREIVERCVIPDRYELPPVVDGWYKAAFDAAGGSGKDEQAMAIAHSECRNGRWVHILDLVVSVAPPFSPQQVAEEFALILKQYGITKIYADAYAGAWPVETFCKCGISYVNVDQPKSEFYREVLPFINSGSVELLDHPKLVNQLCNLERRTGRSGRDTIDHAPGAHDDVINAAAIALVLAARSVALPALDWIDLNINPRPQTALEIAEEHEREEARKREAAEAIVKEQLVQGYGVYFPGD